MARRVKPKISYKKNKKTPKAFIGAATAAIGLGKSIYGGIQASRAKKAEAAFDKSRLETKVSSATQKMADQPIDQNYIEQMQGQQAADRASAMGALSKDPRNALAGVQSLEAQAGKQRTELLGMQQDAKTKAMQNLATEQKAVGDRKAEIAGQELEGIKAEKSAGVQNIFGGVEDIASGVSSIVSKPMKEGGSIDSEDGGVTPGEFDHDSNPIDMVQDGEKIGEATGGELILPPDDVEDIRSALKDGDKDAAFKLLEDLVEKYDSNTIGDEEEQQGDSERQPGQSGQETRATNLMSSISAKMGAYLSRR